MSKTSTEKAAAPVAASGISCYIGPNILGVIQKATIYPCPKNEALKTPVVAKALAKYPGIKDLIVSGEELGAGLIKVKTPGEPLFKAYERLARSL